jgi:hypothetical protein
MAVVEKKVQASTLAAAVSGLVVWLLGRYVLHGTVSPGYIAEIDVAVPGILAFVAGWLAPHTPKPPPAA